jgi:hypothetical protein
MVKLPFRYGKIEDSVLITNEAGQYYFLNSNFFSQYVNEEAVPGRTSTFSTETVERGHSERDFTKEEGTGTPTGSRVRYPQNPQLGVVVHWCDPLPRKNAYSFF